MNHVTLPPPKAPCNNLLSHTFCSLRYSLYFRLACPQPEQPNQALCSLTPRTLILQGIPASILTHTWTKADSSAPVPYTAYQFQVEAENSIGDTTSSFSTAVDTFAEGK